MPLKRPPKYGVCLWWPVNGTDCIHPHDVPKAEDFVPGCRVLKRVDFNDEFSMLHYGAISVRVRPMLWLPVDFEGFDVGDAVQVRSLFGKNEPFIASVSEMFWDDREKRIEYELSRSGRVENRTYLAGDLEHIDALQHQLRKSEFALNMDLAHKRQLAASNLSSWQSAGVPTISLTDDDE